MGMGPGEANDFLYDNGLGVMAKLATSYKCEREKGDVCAQML